MCSFLCTYRNFCISFSLMHSVFPICMLSLVLLALHLCLTTTYTHMWIYIQLMIISWSQCFFFSNVFLVAYISKLYSSCSPYVTKFANTFNIFGVIWFSKNVNINSYPDMYTYNLWQSLYDSVFFLMCSLLYTHRNVVVLFPQCCPSSVKKGT